MVLNSEALTKVSIDRLETPALESIVAGNAVNKDGVTIDKTLTSTS